jgi:hypothetical protein
MIKKLSAKVQQLNSQITQENKGFSGCIVIEPEERDVALKKGSIYGVYYISAENEFDTNLVKNIINDVLKESYFQTDSISPIQSIEKAIIDVKEKVTNLLVKGEEQKLNFNILCSVLWGNVLYVVKFGEGESFLVRQGEIRDIKTMSEGSFSAASGVIKDDDVVIIGTKPFSETYPPHKLLSMAIAEQALQPAESGILLKFMVDTDFTQDEIVDFGLEGAQKPKKSFKVGDTKVKGAVMKAGGLVGAVINKVKGIKLSKPKEEPQTTSIRLKSAKKFNLKFGPKLIVPIALFALFISIVYTIRNREEVKDTEPAKTEQETNLEPTQEQPAEEEPEEPEEPQESAEEIFYDIKLTDIEADPTEIVVFPSYVVVVDKNKGKIYTSRRDEPKFEAKEDTFVGIDSLQNAGNGELFFDDDEGFKFYDIVEGTIVDSYSQETGSSSSTYLGYMYTANNGSILKYTAANNTLEEEAWSTDAEFENARSISIAYSIYVLTQDSSVVSYTSGTKDTFELTGLETPLNDAVELVTDLDYDNIYIADRGNKRVVSLDKDGNFVKEYRSETVKEWDDLKNIGISPDETVMYVLNGSRVYEIQL